MGKCHHHTRNTHSSICGGQARCQMQAKGTTRSSIDDRRLESLSQLLCWRETGRNNRIGPHRSGRGPFSLTGALASFYVSKPQA